MNLVLDDAEEIHSKTKSRKQLGMSACLCNLNALCCESWLDEPCWLQHLKVESTCQVLVWKYSG